MNLYSSIQSQTIGEYWAEKILRLLYSRSSQWEASSALYHPHAGDEFAEDIIYMSKPVILRIKRKQVTKWVHWVSELVLQSIHQPAHGPAVEVHAADCMWVHSTFIHSNQIFMGWTFLLEAFLFSLLSLKLIIDLKLIIVHIHILHVSVLGGVNFISTRFAATLREIMIHSPASANGWGGFIHF